MNVKGWFRTGLTDGFQMLACFGVGSYWIVRFFVVFLWKPLRPFKFLRFTEKEHYMPVRDCGQVPHETSIEYIVK